METNDFLGSFAQENVSFSTQIIKSSSVGDNFWTVMVFVESDRFVTATEANGWEDAPGLPSCKVLVVTADTYSANTTGLLASWLYDLFANGFTGNCILVAPAASTAPAVITYSEVTPVGTENPSSEGWYEYDGTDYTLTADTEIVEGKKYYVQVTTDGFQAAMEEAYEVLKPYAYHKTVCAGGETAVSANLAVSLAKKCAADTYMSGAPLLPVVNTELSSDPLYSALMAASADAFMAWHSDTTRNGALYSLGLALAVLNGSGTSVGNAMDMTASSNITASNEGVNPTAAQKNTLKSAYVQYFKTVGDNSGNVASETDKTILGKVYSAYWILAYITYMTKVGVAQLITQRNFFKSALSYNSILGIMRNLLNTMAASGVLTGVNITAPAYDALPEASDDTIIIPNAWSAIYVNHLRKVTITGNLYIGA
jgi:hypothetical protein